MQTVLTFLTAYYPYVIVVVLGLIGAVLFGRKKALSVAYALLEQYKDILVKAVNNQHDVYAQFIYDHIPIYLKVFLTEKMVDAVVVDFINMLEASKPVPTPVPEPVPTPEPTPEPTPVPVVPPVDNNQK